VGGPNIGITVLEESLEVQASFNILETWFLILFANQSIWLSPPVFLYITQASGFARFIYCGRPSTRLRHDPLIISEKPEGDLNSRRCIVQWHSWKACFTSFLRVLPAGIFHEMFISTISLFP